jgi:hypothetical protein
MVAKNTKKMFFFAKEYKIKISYSNRKKITLDGLVVTQVSNGTAHFCISLIVAGTTEKGVSIYNAT